MNKLGKWHKEPFNWPDRKKRVLEKKIYRNKVYAGISKDSLPNRDFQKLHNDEVVEAKKGMYTKLVSRVTKEVTEAQAKALRRYEIVNTKSS